MADPDITLYGSVFSRTFSARWMLAELDLPYRLEVVDSGTIPRKDAAPAGARWTKSSM